MKGYLVNIEDASKENDDFRSVIYTAKHSQLVLASLKPGEDIGEEVHDVDQFIRVEEGEGEAVLNGESHELSSGSAVVVPAGVRHNIINTSDSDEMKLYTIYSPPQHKDGLVHKTKSDSEKSDLAFDGKTTEGG